MFYTEESATVYAPAREIKPDTHMLVVPDGFMNRFRAAYKEFHECQNLINKLVTGQDLDYDFNS